MFLIFFLFSSFTFEGKEKIKVVNFYKEKELIKRIEGDFYGYKTDKNNNLYLIEKDYIYIFDNKGKELKRIKDKGAIEVSKTGKYLLVYDDKEIRIYKNFLIFFKVNLKEKALRKAIFSEDEKYLALLYKNSFSFFDLNNKNLLWEKEFSLPLILGRIFDTSIILISEKREELLFETYQFDYQGNLINKFSDYYEKEDEIILGVEIKDEKIFGKSYNKKYLLNSFNKRERKILYKNFLSDTIPWPLPPTDSLQPLGNNWGEYQNYGSSAYFHPGIDIITPNRQGVAVYAIKDGWVKAWLTLGGNLYWRLAIADSSLQYADSCEGFLYAHIDSSRYHKQVGDYVQRGELIGYLVPWPVNGFDHIHFAKIKDAGNIWPRADWVFVFNPLILLRPNLDTIPPIFEYARLNHYFAFCLNNTSNYLNPDSLYGDVDIIAKIFDKFSASTGNNVWDRLIPLKIEYEIIGEYETLPRTLSFSFSSRLPNDQLISVVYKQDNICRTRGDYNYRDYYFIITNTDGDSIIESSDANYSWQTRNFPNGRYLVKVYAYDASNNCSVCSMYVRIRNPSGIIEKAFKKKYSSKKEIYYLPSGQKVEKIKRGIYFVKRENNFYKVIKIK
ncbi:MAG: M23 family metallopeptidase [candidate division WOR-3 bacterium]|nr:M23 family metallopeptidase [candidate division WOR-3 bacterium]